MRRIGLILAVVLAMLMFGALPASAGRTPDAVFTLDTSNPNAADVAKMFSTGTEIAVKVGPCEGYRCIEVTVVDVPCGGGGLQVPAGCAYGNGVGGCQIELSPSGVPDSALGFNILGHETGHCVGLPHSLNARSLMYAYIDRYGNRKSLTKDDKSILKARY
jgi:hypothetical protein